MNTRPESPTIFPKGRTSRHSSIHAASAIIAASAVLCVPLIADGYLSGHSGQLYALWVQQFLKSVNSGTLYPSWAADTNGGTGGPTFIFYPPFIFYASAAIGAFVKNILTILCVFSITGMAAAGATMYLCCRTFFTGKTALFLALIYMASPYHLINLYERTALSEFWAFVWIPLAFRFAITLKNKRRLSFAGLSLSYALLVVTHIPTALVFTPFMLALVIFLSASEKDRKLPISYAAALLTGAGISCFYLVPALLEQKFIDIQDIFEGWYLYSNNFLFSDMSGDMDLNRRLGIMALAIAPMPPIAVISWLMGRKKGPYQHSGIAVFAAVSAALSIFLMFHWSNPVWRLIPVIQKIQFPWRLLLIETFFALLCMGFILDHCRHRSSGWQRPVLWSALALVLIANIWLSAVHVKGFALSPGQGDRFRDWRIYADMTYPELRERFGIYYGNPSLVDDLSFRPLWGADEDVRRLINVPEPLSTGSLGLFDNYGILTVDIWDPELRSLRAYTASTDRLVLRTFYYPRWRARINGKTAPITPDPATGLISLCLPEGESFIRLELEAGPYRRVGAVISALSLAATALAVLLILPRRRP
jgi:hypothetical protein